MVRRKQPRHWTRREEVVRNQVLVRDNYECQIRGPLCLGIANTVDHIHPKAWGGTAHPENLRAACKPCNLSKGARSDDVAFFRSSTAGTRPLRKIPPQTSRWTPKVSEYSGKEPAK